MIKTQGGSAILRRALQDSNEMTHADVVIVNADIPDEQVFANLTDINKTRPKPIVMFTEESKL